MNTFIQVLYGLTEVLTVLQCSFMSPYTNSQIYSLRNIFPMASRFLHRSGLCCTPVYVPGLRTGPASLIGPNRSGPRLAQPIRPMLSLSLNICPNTTIKWIRISQHFTFILALNLYIYCEVWYLCTCITKFGTCGYY